jgi:hypothetical protein
MRWNLDNIKYLYPPDAFLGTFDNEKMQSRNEALKENKIEAIQRAVENAADPLEALSKLHKRDQVRFLMNNRQAFNDAGMFEEAVMRLYRVENSPFLSGGDFNVWTDLFNSSDPERLYNLGSPITFASATVYRISVTEGEKSLSWTLSREKIKQFEDRWQQQKIGNAIIYTLDTKRENILAYLTDRHEEEVILTAAFLQTARIRKLTPLTVFAAAPARR